MVYQALTFDTQTVRTNSFDFDGGMLHKLRTLKHNTIQVVISDIVQSEILKHLTEHNQQLTSQLASAIRKARDYGIADINVDLGTHETPRQLATARIAGYLRDLNAKTVSSNKVPVRDLMTRYFQGIPPFSSGGKKDEFPDAVTLLSLEAWAIKHDVRVLAISGDNDWSKFADGSKYIDVVKDIPSALDVLIGQAQKARDTAAQFVAQVSDEGDKFLRNRLFESIARSLENLYFSPDAESPHHVEGEDVEVTLVNYTIDLSEPFDLISVEPDHSGFSVVVHASLSIHAEASFYVSTYDTIDHDYVSLGAVTASKEDDLDAEVMISVSHEEGSFEIEFSQIVSAPGVIHFGLVEPDLSNEYYEQGSLF